MNFAALRTELAGRGFDHLTPAQLGLDINDARQFLDHMHLWPYREKSVTGVAPLTVTDLGTIEAVTNETGDYPLASGDYRSLLDSGDLGRTGAPHSFYVAYPAGVPVVATYPTGGDTIGVQYYRVTPDLVDDSDTPAAPDRFHMLIVDLAAQRAYLRTDNPMAASALQPFIEQRLAGMRDQLLGGQQISGPSGHTAVYWACDG